MWHGNFCWNELYTRDAEAAKNFYGAIAGWSFEEMKSAEGAYWVGKKDGQPVCGIFTMTDPAFAGIPEHWIPYIAVDDTDGSVDTLKEMGGAALRDPFDVPNVGRLAIVKDSGGAVLALMTPLTPAPQQ